MSLSESTVRELRTEAEIRASFNVMKELRPQLVEHDYTTQVQRMMQQGYRLLSLGDPESVAVAGFRLSESLAFGKFLYVDDLVTRDGQRSQGAGRKLLARLREIARAEGCRELHLDSGVQRHAAHRFYLRERTDITCFHFREIL